jgi:hypothetical protein
MIERKKKGSQKHENSIADVGSEEADQTRLRLGIYQNKKRGWRDILPLQLHRSNKESLLEISFKKKKNYAGDVSTGFLLRIYLNLKQKKRLAGCDNSQIAIS